LRNNLGPLLKSVATTFNMTPFNAGQMLFTVRFRN
jgi:hypothetical protein